ncbi:hypothetical protein Fmac_011255 [Flemingia macrophylla]|uniref:UBE2O-like tandem tSH3-B domain-containing protein n=1 Tax=Flemingia macrophylla TaxID=520843 RepID=A0ABD1MLX4_9FABA
MKPFGLMDPVIGDSDWDTSSDNNSSEDQKEIDFLYGGKAQSILSSLELSIGRIDDFLSFERAFIHGDVVCSLSDPSGQMGRVTDFDIFVDLESVKGKILKNLNSKNLLRIRSILDGDYVIKGPWLGRVQRVVDKVIVLYDDGTKCDITALEREKVLPLTRNFAEDSQYPYYPGLRVKVKSSNTSKSTRWLCDTWRDNHDEGTICVVESSLVFEATYVGKQMVWEKLGFWIDLGREKSLVGKTGLFERDDGAGYGYAGQISTENDLGYCDDRGKEIGRKITFLINLGDSVEGEVFLRGVTMEDMATMVGFREGRSLKAKGDQRWRFGVHRLRATKRGLK